MSDRILGVDIDDLRLPPKEALRRASELEFSGVEFSAVAGDLAPENLSESGRRHLTRFIEGLNLRAVSLVADLPQLRLTDARGVEERVERTRRIMDLATDLKVPIVTTSIGAITHPETGEPSPVALDALRLLGEHADKRGRVLALRPAAETGDRLAKALSALRCPALRIGLDPAAIIMTGANPRAMIETFANNIALFYGRDATAGSDHGPGAETAWGEGDIDMPGLLAALEEAEFRGPCVLRRTNSRMPAQDLASARSAWLQMASRH